MNLITLASIPAILAIVQLLKDVGFIKGKWAALAAVVLGLVFSLADYGFLGEEPLTRAGWYIAAISGIILGLSASGLYEGAKIVGKSLGDKLNADVTVSPSALNADSDKTTET